ncbi:hypothetical protein OsJ_13470 [Oryza sativa Japonica Group]|uniref:Leucine-rich repeat-containing N-terminal plant-type domain-containing protein n=1 Tax=Oryza sativa subsp. japonica TaxID=39947 RepID=B9F815_ORYSJ|nr:hypothetical protein OsJ_13470 [Oryza sativa Japonica Group]
MAPAILNLSSSSSFSPQHAIVLLVHLIILLSCHAVKQSAARSVNYSEMDRQALLSFKASTSSDPVGVLHSWSTSSLDFCNWSGVRCGTGSKSLRVVNLAFNSLAGGIPHSLASSSSLTVLNLTNNLFFGTIPASLFNGSSNLAIIDLRMNAFSGPIPNFYKMSALQILNLAQNNLSGSIPPSLGKVSSINLISLEMNNLEGSIPETLSNIKNLSMLSLGYNMLTRGYGGFGALGHYVYHRELLPRKVNGPWEGKISHIATRGAHTAAITDSGELYNWGCDEGDRRLGLGSRGGPGAAGSLSVPSKNYFTKGIGIVLIGTWEMIIVLIFYLKFFYKYLFKLKDFDKGIVFSEVAVDVRAPSAYGSYLNVCRRLFIGHNNPHHVFMSTILALVPIN